MIHPFNGISFSIKKNELSGYETTWRELKYTWLSERNQSEKSHVV
jgi:hypothetical protein